MTLSTQPYKGARDFYPQDMLLQNYIFDNWRTVVKSFGYLEYNAPIIEPIELYLAKTSEEIVNEQTYAFEDRGGRKVTLRPEMTPTVSRMVANQRQELAYPARWFSIPNLWRYERPQKGRLREHWQLNVDLFGVAGIEGDHELIMMADAIMQKFNAPKESYVIKLNSRMLINFILAEHLSLDAEKSKQLVRLIDKKQKMPEDDFKNIVFEVIGPKSTELIDLLQTQDLQNLPESIKNCDYAKQLHNLQVMLVKSGVTSVVFDISLMRGFDYYTDIVFEVYDNNPENSRSIFGGGRYDGLIGQFDVEPLPTVGFGLGDVTFADFLKTHKLTPELKQDLHLDVILIGDVYIKSQELIGELRQAGVNLAVDSTHRKLDKQLKSAVKAGFKYVLFIGEDDLNSRTYNLKDLTTGQEQHLSVDKLITTLLN